MLQEGVKIKGAIRVRLGEDIDGKHEIVGDSGWVDNMVVNLGVRDYILEWLQDGAGGKEADTIIVGTGGAPASNATAIAGSTVQSAGGTSDVGSRTHQVTNDWQSGEHPGGTPAISNAALANQGTGSYTIFCGGSFDTSTWNSNQALSITYQVQFPTS
jgi:hypothetical protein